MLLKMVLGGLLSCIALHSYANETLVDDSATRKADSSFAMALAVTVPSHLLACSVRYPELQPQIDSVEQVEPSAKAQNGEMKTLLEKCFKENEVITKPQCEAMLNLLLEVAKNKQWTSEQRQAYLGGIKVTHPRLSSESKACWRAAKKVEE